MPMVLNVKMAGFSGPGNQPVEMNLGTARSPNHLSYGEVQALYINQPLGALAAVIEGVENRG